MFVAEPEAHEVEELWAEADSVICLALGYLEIRSAIARRLKAQPAARARALLHDRWQEVETLVVDDRLIAIAGRIVDVHRLKTLDALHLAAALDAGRPGLVFMSWDSELRRAAQIEGLAVTPTE